MEREDVIDLGAASIETKGDAGPFGDVILTQLNPGLNDD